MTKSARTGEMALVTPSKGISHERTDPMGHLLTIHAGLFAAFFLTGVIGMQYRRTFSFWTGVALAFGAMTILALPALMHQVINGWPGLGGGIAGTGIIVLLAGFPFNVGGWTVTHLFEATVEPLEWLVGHRSSTVISNMPYYWALLALQCAVIATLTGLLYRLNTKIARAVLVILALAYSVNSIANVTWFYFGS